MIEPKMSGRWGGLGFGTLFAPQSVARREGKECPGSLPTPVAPRNVAGPAPCLLSVMRSFPSRLHWRAMVHKSVPKPAGPNLSQSRRRVSFIIAILATLASFALGGEAAEEGFVPLFNGKDLTGWEGNTRLWVVEDGMLIGRSPGIRHNDFLATTRTFSDFILRFQIRLVGGKGNSGVQFRSRRVPNSHEVSGYQADIGGGWWGVLYDEARRNRPLARPSRETLAKALKPADWNDYEVVAIGNKITLKINGVTTVEYEEKDPKIPRSGIIATQIHAGGPMEVQFRNIRIKEIR